MVMVRPSVIGQALLLLKLQNHSRLSPAPLAVKRANKSVSFV